MSRSNATILIVDDSELNRALLSDMLSSDFKIIEVENGKEAVEMLHEHEMEISLVLLDIVMPEMDGFEVLSVMNRKGWIKSIPVIMISAETSGTYIDRAYDLGAIDYISRPFDERTVKHRVTSNFMLTIKQKEMAELLSKQIYEKEKDNSLMIEILSHIVEFRNGESGLHVLHVHAITQMVLEQLVKKTDKYKLTSKDIRLICNASALHDIGKISIPSEILNKPGRFTPEEFAVMKGHTVEGANMLSAIPHRKNEDLIKVGYQICRWHHERYDGKGYPDGIKGDDIPIAAQVVALADVYDALTSKRVYKDAYPSDEAVKMILNGECGAFNPILLECLSELSETLKKELSLMSFGKESEAGLKDAVKQVLNSSDGADASHRSLRLLERERIKYQYLSDISQEVVFEYNAEPELIKFSEWGAKIMGLPVRIADPSKDKRLNKLFNEEDFSHFVELLKQATSDDGVVVGKYLITISRDKKWCKLIAKALFDEDGAFEGAIGKIVDINEEISAMQSLEQKADRDPKTGLLNHDASKRRISAILSEGSDRHFALAVFDLDNFKEANDEYGHLFGDEVLIEIAKRLNASIRSTDIAARMGGDEFILFMEYKKDVEPQFKRVFKNLTVKYKDFDVGVSMGIARAENFSGSYDDLFAMADAAMYSVKRNSKNSYCFYDDSMKNLLQSSD